MNDSEKLDQIRQTILEWDNKKGHNRCWYYPDLFCKIAQILELQLTQTPELPSRAEFEEGCRRYQLQEFGLQTDKFVL